MKNLARSFTIRVYFLMAIALLISALAAYIPIQIPSLMMWLKNPWVFLFLFIITLMIVTSISSKWQKMSLVSSTAMLFIFSAINGLMLSSVFLIYDLGSVFRIFLLCTVFFIILAILGTVTKVDLTKVGYIAFVGLLAAIMMSIFNIFIRSEFIFSFLNIIILIIFVVLTARDAQRVKEASLKIKNKTMLNKMAMPMALSLYLDFINMSLKLLAIFGRRR